MPAPVVPVALVLVAFAALALNPSALGDVYAWMPHGPGFRNVRDYGARGDGVTDDTQAFIRALEWDRGTEGHKAPANVYVPSGTYLLSDTLIVWKLTMLAGDSDNPPMLVLRERAPGFDDPHHPKPLIVTACGYGIAPEARDWHTRTDQLGGSTNNSFFITVRDLKIRIADGNSGAWGIFWLVAQQTALRNVTIDAGSAQGCIKSMWWGGGGVITHLSLHGGDYGWHVQETSQFVLRSTKFSGQRKASLWLNGVWNFALLDLHFQDTAPIQILGGQVSLLDSTFDGISGSAAIESQGTSLVLQNVTTKGVAEVVKGKLRAADPIGPHTVRRWAAGSAMVEGRVLPGEVHDLTETLPPHANPLPSPTYPRMTAAARSVTDFGARGDGVTDDTAAVQRALTQCPEVFFPQGTYLVRETLTLRPDGRLFGEMGSVVELAPDSPGFEDPSSRKPMLAIPDDPDAGLTICHLRFHMSTPGGIYCDWRAGERSMFLDSTFYTESPTQQLNWRISAHGGGFFENSWNPGTSGDGLEITSDGRKWMYAVQQEHYPRTALILRGAKHLTALVLQFETSPQYVRIEDCEDITLFQTIAGTWTHTVPALIHVVGGRDIALFNSVCNNSETVITEAPNGWRAGPRSLDQAFVVQGVWLKGKK